ncbi:MAG: DUF4381 domain-containing protein [Gammaproteobacteria bacterium]|nr:DUF4381 domain-containing protein [Gammaproteobacteria bacterium]
MSIEAGNLDKLHDIIPAPPPPGWPLAPGWYVLFAIFLFLTVWYGYRKWRQYQNDRYRKAALAELAEISGSSSGIELARVPELLKRTALHAYPRAQIASLSGSRWQQFLNDHCDGDLFVGEVWDLLELLAYRPSRVEGKNIPRLLESIRYWIKQHRGEPS